MTPEQVSGRGGTRNAHTVLILQSPALIINISTESTVRPLHAGTWRGGRDGDNRQRGTALATFPRSRSTRSTAMERRGRREGPSHGINLPIAAFMPRLRSRDYSLVCDFPTGETREEAPELEGRGRRRLIDLNLRPNGSK